MTSRYPFRTKLRRRALRLVAAAATAVRAAAAAAAANTAANTNNHDNDATNDAHNRANVVVAAAAAAAAAAKEVGAVLDQNVWPALAALLEADHPARGSGGVDEFSAAGSGCTRYAIEAAARTIAALLQCGSWQVPTVPLTPQQ